MRKKQTITLLYFFTFFLPFVLFPLSSTRACAAHSQLQSEPQPQSHSPLLELNPQSEKQIKALVQDYESSWNKHDAKALAQIFSENVGFITVTGVWLKNREEFFKAHEKIHREGYKKSVFKSFLPDVQVQLIQENVALVYWTWEIKGVLDAEGKERPPYKGIFTWVVVKDVDKDIKDGERWLVRSSQNTISN